MSNLLIGSALLNNLTTNGTVTTYYGKAPQSATPPYCLIYFVTSNDDYTFNDNGINADYQIKVISNKNFPEEAIRLYQSQHVLTQDANLSIPGYKLMRIRRVSTFEFEDQFHYWNVGGLYNLDVWKT